MLRHLSKRTRLLTAVFSLLLAFASYSSPWYGWMDDEPEWKYPALIAIPFGYALGAALYQGGCRQVQLDATGIGLFGILGAGLGFFCGWFIGAVTWYERGPAMFSAFHAGTMSVAAYLLITTALALHQPARKAFKQPRRFKPPSR